MRIIKNHLELKYKIFKFPAGEVSVKLETTDYKFLTERAPYTTIVAPVRSSDDFFALAQAKEALERLDETLVRLALPYVPYARQDRASVPGEAFSLKVMGHLINSLGFEKVTVLDPHSHVVEAVIDDVEVVSQFDLIRSWEAFKVRVLKGTAFVAPDAGANKKTSELAEYFGHTEFIRADKLRNLQTGEIKETVVYADDLDGTDVVIADDICDGGRTFIELAKVLKAKNAGKINLYVTHGIFSKGTATLLQNGIDEIWTTDSYHVKSIIDPQPNLHVLETLNLLT